MDGFQLDEYLEHYGILGMRWGVTRTPEQLGHIPSQKRYPWSKREERKIVPSEDRKKVDNLLKTKKISEMSNDELNTVINRILKERQVKELSRTPPTLLKKFLQSSGKKIGASALKAVAYTALDKAAADIDDGTDMGRLMKTFLTEMKGKKKK
jgi:hypothetical protein